MANIANLLKGFLISLMALIAPYLFQGLLKVVIPLLVESLTAVLTGNQAQIDAAKQKVKDSWKTYVKDAANSAGGTASLIDDWLFTYLNAIELDDVFVAKIFDQAVALEQKFFRPTA